jgi:hypothetical protein
MSKTRATDYVAPQERELLSENGGAPSHEDIAALAHELWIARGRTDGAAEEDWLEAERQLGVRNGKDLTS